MAYPHTFLVRDVIFLINVQNLSCAMIKNAKNWIALPLDLEYKF